MNQNILGVLSLVVAILIYPFALKDLVTQYKDTKNEIQMLEENVDKAKKFIDLRDELIQKKESFTDSEISRLEKILPEDINIVQLALDIEKLAIDSGLILQGNVGATLSDDKKRSNNKEESSPISSITLDLNFRGVYNNLSRFLQALSKSMPLLNVSSISFSGGEIDVYDYSISLETYKLNKEFVSDTSQVNSFLNNK